MRRRHPKLEVTSTYPLGEPDGWELDIKGGTKAGRDKAMAFAKKFARGLATQVDEMKRLELWRYFNPVRRKHVTTRFGAQRG